jgi:hypothetical protein
MEILSSKVTRFIKLQRFWQRQLFQRVEPLLMVVQLFQVLNPAWIVSEEKQPQPQPQQLQVFGAQVLGITIINFFHSDLIILTI